MSTSIGAVMVVLSLTPDGSRRALFGAVAALEYCPGRINYLLATPYIVGAIAKHCHFGVKTFQVNAVFLFAGHVF